MGSAGIKAICGYGDVMLNAYKSATDSACPASYLLSQAITVGGVSEGGVELAGRSLNISMAVDRAQAKVLETQNKEKDEKKDARNLWLAKEGCMCRVTVSSASGPSTCFMSCLNVS